jgi:hypothetical protein
MREISGKNVDDQAADGGWSDPAMGFLLHPSMAITNARVGSNRASGSSTGSGPLARSRLSQDSGVVVTVGVLRVPRSRDKCLEGTRESSLRERERASATKPSHSPPSITKAWTSGR